jgi:hypothetical protein
MSKNRWPAISKFSFGLAVMRDYRCEVFEQA